MKPQKPNLPIPIKELAKKVICEGHIFLRTSEDRRFYLLRPGTMIDSAFVRKYAPTNTVFEMDLVTNVEVIQKFQTLFRELKYLQFERDLRSKSLDIIRSFEQSFSTGEHFLSFAIACFQEFNLLSSEQLTRMHETDTYLFRKALYSGAFAIIIGLSNDFYHYPILKDFFNLTFGLDIGLCDPNYSYYVSEACNQENQNPGQGRIWMNTEGATDQEVAVYLKHPARSYLFFKDNSSMLAYPELAEVILYQHELSEGNGFPRGISKGQISSWEGIVILADALVEIKNEYDFERDIINYIGTFKNKKLNELPVQRIYQKLCYNLSHCKEASAG
jgi:hypothetical protein